MYRRLFCSILLLTLLTFTLVVCAAATSLPETRDNDTDTADHDPNKDEDEQLKQDVAQLMTQLEELRQGHHQLREEVNAKTGWANNVQRTVYGPPHHFHHYYHHHRTPLYPPSDVDATDDLSTLRELLQATQNRLRTTELTLQQTQTKLLTLEDRLETEVDDQQATHSRPRSCEDKLIATQERLESAERKLALVDEVDVNTQTLNGPFSHGSTFVRWGKSQCPNSTQEIYSGVMGGSHYSHKGAAANKLCLTLQPEYDDTATTSHMNYLHGVEYEFLHGHHNHDAPCSVCRAPQSTTIMVPATLTCPPGWVTQYTGHLVAGYYDHPTANEYLCLDKEPDDRAGGKSDSGGALVYYVATWCGSLPCPPYVNNKVATCVVCSL